MLGRATGYHQEPLVDRKIIQDRLEDIGLEALKPPVPSRPANTDEQALPKPSWMVKYKAGGLALKPNKWLRTAFVSRGVLEHLRAPLIAVSSDKLSAVYFDQKAEWNSDLLQGTTRSGCAYAKHMMPGVSSQTRPGTFVATMASPHRASRLLEHLNVRSPVQLVWSENGAERSVTIGVNRCEYAAFVETFRWFVGARWPEVGREFRH